MTEDEARGLVADLVAPAAIDRLDRFVAMVIAENDRQNLIARSTIAAIWVRHVLDSVQLLRWAGETKGRWLDIGTGGGFPGLAIALCTNRPMTLAEPRRRRAAFLADVVDRFGMGHVTVVQTAVENLRDHKASVISARAVAPLETLFAAARASATTATWWLLPRGGGATRDVESARRSWHGVFHVEQSLTDPAAGVVVATNVTSR